jgi:hypothetical protein
LISFSEFFGIESLAAHHSKHLPPSTGEGKDRGVKKISPAFVLPSRGGEDRSGAGSRWLFPAGKLKLSFAALFFLNTFSFLLVLSSSAQEKKLDSFTISYASVSGTRAPLWIAKDLGLFEKYGLDGNLIYIASGVTSVNALLGGSVDIIAASGSSAVGAAARGAPLVIIASLGHIAYKLIAHPSITTVQALKGKIIGSSRIGAGTDYALQRLLPKLGLTPGKDVQLIPTGISESDRRLLCSCKERSMRLWARRIIYFSSRAEA